MGGEFDELGPYPSMESSRGRRRVGAWALFVVVTAAVVFLVKGLYPADLPPNPSPDFVDNVFDNRGVLWAARLLLVSAAGVLAVGGVFIVLSIGIRMKNGEWLRRAGPFEVSEGEAGDVEEDFHFWRQTVQRGQGEVLELREDVKRLEKIIGALRNR